MRSTVIALVASVALLASVAPVFAMGGSTYQGPLHGTYSIGSGTTESGFNGAFSGSALSGGFDGFTGLASPVNHTPVSGTIITSIGPIGFSGFFSGHGAGGVFSGKIWRASEPLTALVVGLGLLGVRFIRRR